MKQITNKEYEKYQQYQTDKLHGRILTPDGLRVICAGLDNDPEKIGIAVSLGVDTIPALFFYRGGKLEKKLLGYMTKSEIEEKLGL